MAMPTTQSPPINASGVLGTVHPSQNSFCTSSPNPPSISPESPRVSDSTTSTVFQESAAIKDERCLSPSLMDFSNASTMQWTSQYDLTTQLTQNGNVYPTSSPVSVEFMADYGYNANNHPFNANYNLSYSFPSDSACSRTFMSEVETDTPMSQTTAEFHPPAAYVNEAPQHHDGMELSEQNTTNQLLQYNIDFNSQCMASVKAEESAYDSPYGSVVGTPCASIHDDMCGMSSHHDDGAIDKEQPYAQLIYKALMAAPGHTMVLRDIYNWFKENTDKAADKEAKGWQNSIRHNLSMNGAFEKVDQPCEDSRKGFMWRLTASAVRNGVKSTTRYRSKQPNKRAHRSSNPLPQRQASGAKGGHASKRSARLRRSQRSDLYASAQTGMAQYHPDRYMHRSVPAGYHAKYDASPYGPPFEQQPILDPHGVHASGAYQTSSPYYGGEMPFDSPLSAISEFDAVHSQSSKLGSPLLSPGCVANRGMAHPNVEHQQQPPHQQQQNCQIDTLNQSNMNGYSHQPNASAPNVMASHGQLYNGPFHNNTAFVMHDYATDDSLSTAASPSSSEPHTPQDGEENFYMDMEQDYLLEGFSPALQE